VRRIPALRHHQTLIIAGDVLLTTKPHVSALSNDHLEGNCSNCVTTGTPLSRCTGCRTLFYCNSVGNQSYLSGHLFYTVTRNAKKRIGVCINKSALLSRDGLLPPRPFLEMPFDVWEEYSGRNGNLDGTVHGYVRFFYQPSHLIDTFSRPKRLTLCNRVRHVSLSPA